MSFSKKDVMSFVRECLGENPEGLFVDSAVSSGDIEPEESDIYTNITKEDVLEYSFQNCNIEMGITKLVIIPKERNYVIKIPFTGTYNYDEENDKFIINSIIKNRNSIMREEKEIFESSTELMQEILLENYFIDFFNNCIPIYIQRKAVPCSRNSTTHLYLKLKKNNNIKLRIADYLKRKYNTDLNVMFILKLITIYGINISTELIYDILKIDDLHLGNYGYDIKNDYPVIIDYGGYDVSMWSSN